MDLLQKYHYNFTKFYVDVLPPPPADSAGPFRTNKKPAEITPTGFTKKKLVYKLRRTFKKSDKLLQARRCRNALRGNFTILFVQDMVKSAYFKIIYFTED